jgi:hypothetical protein
VQSPPKKRKSEEHVETSRKVPSNGVEEKFTNIENKNYQMIVNIGDKESTHIHDTVSNSSIETDEKLSPEKDLKLIHENPSRSTENLMTSHQQNDSSEKPFQLPKISCDTESNNVQTKSNQHFSQKSFSGNNLEDENEKLVKNKIYSRTSLEVALTTSKSTEITIQACSINENTNDKSEGKNLNLEPRNSPVNSNKGIKSPKHTFKRSLSLKRNEKIEHVSNNRNITIKAKLEMASKKMDQLAMEEKLSSNLSVGSKKALNLPSNSPSTYLHSMAISTSTSLSSKSPLAPVILSAPLSPSSLKLNLSSSSSIPKMCPHEQSLDHCGVPTTQPTIILNSTADANTNIDQSTYEKIPNRRSPNATENSNSLNAVKGNILSIPSHKKSEGESPSRTKNFNFQSISQASQKLLKIIPPESLMTWFKTAKSRSNFKYEIAYSSMKQTNSIIALFKCMAMHCSFATSDVNLILKHLTQHEEASRQNNQKDFHLYCAYCTVKFESLSDVSTTVKQLVHHINDIHRKDIYQCGLCFYRSCEKGNVNNHSLKEHGNGSIVIYESADDKDHLNKIMPKVKERLKTKRKQFVIELRCKCE